MTARFPHDDAFEKSPCLAGRSTYAKESARYPGERSIVLARNAARCYRRLVSLAWWSGQPLLPIWASRLTPTCCATPAAISSPMTVTIRGQSRRISGIAISRTRRATRLWRRSGSSSFLEIDEDCLPVFLPTGSAVGFTMVLLFAPAVLDRKRGGHEQVPARVTACSILVV